MIGRFEEKHLVGKTLERAIDGQGVTILLSGSPGIGKSVLVREVKDLASSMDFHILEGGCLPNAEPFLPFIQADDALKSIVMPERRITFDEIFLVDSKSGLLMSHLSNVSTSMDEDILGGMLTAVMNFVKDSFGDEEDKSALAC